MFVIIGLGNPGQKFKNTRHNVGFMTVDFFAKKNELPKFKLSKRHEAFVVEKNDILLVKPQTFMNESGRAVKKIISNFKFQISNLVVIHDDIDLPLGKLKISKDSGSGGHKGVDSIIKHLGTKDFIQFKIGICPKKAKPTAVETFIIKKFTKTKEELEIINSAIEKTSQALDYFLKNGLEKTMNEYNR